MDQNGLISEGIKLIKRRKCIIMKLNETQVSNAKYIYDFFLSKNWTPQAICGMLGNMQTESYLYADIWEGGNKPGTGKGPGYGLVQWTPANKLIDWCKENGLDYKDIDSQCKRIQYEMTSGIQFYPSKAYSMTNVEFMNSTQPAYTLGLVFLSNYERPRNPRQPNRGRQAAYWYNNLAQNDVFLEEVSNIPTYTIQPGDTLTALAKTFKVTESELKNWNNISNIDLIKVGEVLKVSDHPEKKTSSNTYQVKPGDTLTAIASKFNVSVPQLTKWNNISNANSIKSGQVLKIRNKL